VKTLGQFCSVARALDVLGERWSLLIVRELLSGSHRFSEIRRGIPRISRTMLSTRLRELTDVGVLERKPSDDGTIYELTAAGRELESVVREVGVWGQRWLPRTLPREELDADTLVWDIRRRVRADALPETPIVARIELTDVRGRAGAIPPPAPHRGLAVRREPRLPRRAPHPRLPPDADRLVARRSLAPGRTLGGNDRRGPSRVGPRVPVLVSPLRLRGRLARHRLSTGRALGCARVARALHR
jgi:DNA-binding HxlR family transcriptional regulator